MILAISGSRSFRDYEKFSSLMEEFQKEFGNVEGIVSGGASGVDSLARRFAKERRIPFTEFLPNWKKYGRAAGPIRNQQIIDESTSLLAIWDGCSTGTLDAIMKAHKKGLSPIVIYLFKREGSPWSLLDKIDMILFSPNSKKFATRTLKAFIPDLSKKLKRKKGYEPSLIGRLGDKEVYAVNPESLYFGWISSKRGSKNILIFDQTKSEETSMVRIDNKEVIISPDEFPKRKGKVGEVFFRVKFSQNNREFSLIN